MNTLYINTVPGNVYWTLNDNLQKEYNNVKIVKATDTYSVVSTDDTLTYAIFPLETTVLIYVNP